MWEYGKEKSGGRLHPVHKGLSPLSQVGYGIIGGRGGVGGRVTRGLGSFTTAQPYRVKILVGCGPSSKITMSLKYLGMSFRPSFIINVSTKRLCVCVFVKRTRQLIRIQNFFPGLQLDDIS